MTEPHDSAPDPAEDETIDGHTLDELAEYLAAGRRPPIASIENSASCRLYLAALNRLRERSWSAFDDEAKRQPDRDEGWIGGLLATIKNEVRSGRDIPIDDPDPSIRLTISEAAVHGLIRHAADTLDDIVLARAVLDGDVTAAGAPIVVRVSAVARYGRNLIALADALRERIRVVLSEHTELEIADILVTISDLYTERRRPDER